MDKKVLFILLFNIQFIKAQVNTVTLNPAKDNTIFSENSTYSDGAGILLYAGKINNGSGVRRALLQFDLSSIPEDVIINDAKLELYVYKSKQASSTVHNFSIHRLNADWGEAGSNGSGSGAPAQNGDATWSDKFYPGQNWTATGGDFNANASATTTAFYSYVELKKSTWTGNDVIADVNYWLTNPLNNYGWILIGEENNNGSAKGFVSRNMGNPYTSFRPALTITYTLNIPVSVIINEVNSQKKWVEIYNPTSNPIDLNGYYLANANQEIPLNDIGIKILHGNLNLLPDHYLLIEWSEIGSTTGELALYKGNPTSSQIIDYLQYGASNQMHSADAVTASVWDNSSLFLTQNSDLEKSYSLDTLQNYFNGSATNSSNWQLQYATPTFKNNPCPGSLFLTGDIIPAYYQSKNSSSLNGLIDNNENISLRAGNSILLTNTLEVKSGAIFKAEIGGCQ